MIERTPICKCTERFIDDSIEVQEIANTHWQIEYMFVVEIVVDKKQIFRLNLHTYHSHASCKTIPLVKWMRTL